MAGGLLLAAAVLMGQTGGVVKPAAAKVTDPAKPAREAGLYATIATSMGSIVIKLFEAEAPITVKNFTGLATGTKAYMDPRTGRESKKPLYNGLIFHRVLPGFMIQGGDPLGNGTGGTEPIKDEFYPTLTFDRPGRLAMANAGPETGSCQFFITESPQPHLNGRHTIFGQVVQGQDVVEKIARVPRGDNDRPTTPVRIVRVAIRREGAATRPAGAKPAATKPSVAKPQTTAPKTTAPPKTAAPKSAVPKAAAPKTNPAK